MRAVRDSGAVAVQAGMVNALLLNRAKFFRSAGLASTHG